MREAWCIDDIADGIYSARRSLSKMVSLVKNSRRIAVMIALPEGDPELKKWLAAFRQALERLGWSEGRNIHLDYRFTPAGAHAQELAKELLTLQPDVILAFSTPIADAFYTRTVPIVFIGIADAVGQGFVPTTGLRASPAWGGQGSPNLLRPSSGSRLQRPCRTSVVVTEWARRQASGMYSTAPV
jgi:hypothetical protein